ncbi:epoxide hydrolase 1 [Eremomyces bilateralis CBS 781.70]|uniref:Epoxide hydrolase 1 n=1 Tax=Eremomyces bilateralis CBS 781.70 TaxID=1392243 RepID=A0A6G1GHK5_9PEZI|nr:epoxide hydrolase 1 [Eremomyces bilateralis CBS 781.70]KAF1817350.1 epoxide hydrolase 1 [Eremomyces bilateralis CBS 781.70]
MSAAPFQVSFPEAGIDELKSKLSTVTFPGEIPLGEKDKWERGAPQAEIKRLVEYWKDGFDFKAAEAGLNTMPQFTAPVMVDGFGTLDIHFVHQKSEVERAVPLLFVHGWPGSFIEVQKLLPLLNGDGKGPSFHIVAPSLPNFGFSEGVKKPGFGVEQYVEVCQKLMQTLGYTQYACQGGDWGMYITRALSLLHPESVKSVHINMIRAEPPSFTSNPLLWLQHALTPYSDADKAGLARTAWFAKSGRGYFIEQSTKPQTLGYALADSPVALLAWIVEKLHDWTDAYPWTDDEILTWISIYWFSRAGPAASVRIYYEIMHQSTPRMTDRTRLEKHIVGVPLGLAYFPRELTVIPKTWARTLGKVVWESTSGKGGHFAAWERPDVIAGDLIAMHRKGGPCYGVVKGGNGYTKNVARL